MPYYIQEMCLKRVTHHMLGTQHGPEDMTSTGRDHTMRASCILSVELKWNTWVSSDTFYRQDFECINDPHQPQTFLTLKQRSRKICAPCCVCFQGFFSALITDRNQQWRDISCAYPSRFGLCVGILLSCVSFKAICGCKCDFLFICNQHKIQLFYLFNWMHRAMKRASLIKRVTRCGVSGIDDYSLGSPKCRKTFPSFLSMLSWSLLRRSWYCCCLIFATIYSASCERKVHRNVTQPTDSKHALSCTAHWAPALTRHISVHQAASFQTYSGWEINTVVQVTQPEEMCEPMCDVKWIYLLISKVQKSQDVGVVLITSAKIHYQELLTFYLSINIFITSDILCNFIAGTYHSCTLHRNTSVECITVGCFPL